MTDLEHHFDIPDDPAEFAAWVADKSDEVKRAARLFPLGSPIQTAEGLRWCIGYTPEGALVTIVSNPVYLTREQFDAQVDDCVLLDPDLVVRNTPKH